MKYIVELVTREAPYIGLAYVKNTSLEDNVLNFGKKEEALVIEDKETMDNVLSLISKHNSNRDLVSVMDWITEVGSNKRVFSKNIVW
jgi:UDP-N-acetylglucosamine:LPS N-acetylglucosamine transferase